MKKRTFLARIFATLLLLTTGCAAGASAPLTPKGNGPVVEAAPATEADRAVSALGAELLKAARKEGENTLLSPLSVALALSMTANGAQGDTLAAFQGVLYPGLSLDTVNANCASLLEDYAGLSGKTNCALADSLWLSPELKVGDDFLRACVSGYGAGVFHADFADPRTVGQVNGWIAEHTGGMIQKMLAPDSVDENTAALLVNALYLDTKWKVPFEPEDSVEELFHPGGGRPAIRIQFMSGPVEERRYLSTESETGVILPYDDGRLALLAVMPRSGSLTDYLDGWDGDTLISLVSTAEDTRLLLGIPKFKVEQGTDLTELLEGMGLEIAFDPARADLSGMGTMENGLPLYISKVLHRAVIDVDEQGTEAAAATVVVAEAGCAAPAEPDYETLMLDRPFVYAVVDLERGIPLFLGTLERPETVQQG